MLKLDTGKDNLNNQVYPGFNNLNVNASNAGNYRIVAAFYTNGQKISNEWQFDSSLPLPSLSAFGGENKNQYSLYDYTPYILIVILILLLIVIYYELIKIKHNKNIQNKNKRRKKK